MKTINKLCFEIHQNAIDKGFYENPKNIGEMLCLVHSEVSEALEADRKGKYCKVPGGMINDFECKDDFKEHYEDSVKGTFEEEMADIVIRVFDLCAFKGIDLYAHIEAKMRYNSLREHKHGKKY
jgi:NTP pyrophosphatase (non-canonical NTP hydrolase)